MITVYTILNKSIQLVATPISTPGGEGAVHKIINYPQYSNHCVKVFHFLKRTEAKKNKIAFMISSKPNNLTHFNFNFCWPIELVYDSNRKFIGFIMPLAFVGSEKLYELAALKMSPKLNYSWQKFDRNTTQGLQNRLKVCSNIAIAIHALHQSKIYSIIDLKPQNILLNSEGKISITDIDSFHVSSNQVFHKADVITPEYAPVEYHITPESTRSMHENWDRFSLAVSFYEILLGLHPYAASCNELHVIAETIGDKIKKTLFVHGTRKMYLSMIPPPHKNFNALPQSIRNLFMKAFENGNMTPSERPSAELWGRTLHAYLNQN
ncbi:MAG: protein kinase domain-containing protein [Bacteroidia bacterium]